MKFAPIVPIPMLSDIASSDYQMCLAGATYMHQYRDFYIKARQVSHVILDNGAAEGRMVSDAELLSIAAWLQPHEVVAPDVMHDAFRTVEALHRFYTKVPAPLNLMVVIQGRTWYELNYSLDAALQHNVSSVALPKLLTQHLGSNARLAAAEVIRDTTDIPIHCLGCSKRPSEVIDLARQGIVRGIDTAAPVVLGLQGKSLRHTEYDWEASHSKIEGFWNRQKTDLVEENLGEFERWCNPPTSIG